MAEPEIRPGRPSDIGSTATVEEALRALIEELTGAGIDSPRLDARLLLEAATGLPLESQVGEPRRQLSRVQTDELARLARRRLRREPVSRILGRRQFWGREFEVTPDTLDPRPDSETLIEAALSLAATDLNTPASGATADDLSRCTAEVSPTILDVGTGTGCLLLTLLAEWPAARGVGLDISPSALAVARRNAASLGVAHRAIFVHGDIRDWHPCEGMPRDGLPGDEPNAASQIPASFDLVISNPPYIPTRAIAGLASEVRDHDPREALDGGIDGLAVYRALIPRCRELARGWVIVEVGAGQAAPILDLVRMAEGEAVATAARSFVDLGGHTRCVAWRPRI